MFTPIDVMSAYSLLKSTMSLDEYIQQLIDKQYKIAVLSEWQSLSSAVSFFVKCQQANIKPIIAMSVKLGDDKITLVALNTDGYFELVRLSSLALTEGIALEALKSCQHVAYVFDRNVSDTVLHQIDRQRAYISIYVDDMQSVTFAKENNLKMLANRHVRYANPNDYSAFKLLQAIDRNQILPKEVLQQTGKHYLPYAEDYKSSFYTINLADIYNDTQNFLNAIAIDIPLQQRLLPKFSGKAAEMLREVAYEGLSKRGLSGEVYTARLDKELSIISDMGFSDYFLIVWDLMAYAHRQQIMTGAGRGSSAASLVSYCLNITQVDPVKENLLFERFLNPERYTMPDIDLDFPDDKRYILLKYVSDKYGKDNVAQIATFGTFAAKQAMRDVGRSLGLSSKELSQLAHAMTSSETLAHMYEQLPQFKKLIDYNPLYHTVFNLAQKIEGLPRHVSTHAAGVVISDQRLSHLIPIQHGSDIMPLTQFTMQDVERVGLLKMDFLGLRNLSILADAQEAIHTFDPNFDIWQIDWSDDKVLRLFSRGDTEGIFQFESAGIKRVLKQVKPTSLQDVVAVNALYRPGPMEQIDTFSKRKHGQQEVTYIHPDLEPILRETHGIIVYQEQVMQIAYRMANFSLGQADLLRRAIGKMQKDIMLQQKESFVSRSVSNGYSQQEAEAVFQYIEKFANYGFPKSHAFAYSMLAYQLAYIKAHYPHVFYLALLLHTNAKSNRFANYLIEAKQNQVTVLKPNINKSQLQHTVADEFSIQFGLLAIQGVRKDILQHIIFDRRQKGSYQSFEDFVLRLPEKMAKREILETLIYSGACDCFGETRATLIANIDVVKEKQLLLFNDLFETKYDTVDEFDAHFLKDKELSILGYAFTNTDENQYESYYVDGTFQSTRDVEESEHVILYGQFQSIRRIPTKHGKRMAFAVLEDQFGKANLTIFPDVYTKVMNLLKEKQSVVVHAKIQQGKHNQMECIVERMQSIEVFEQHQSEAQSICYIKLPNELAFQQLKPILKTIKGNMPIVLYLQDEGVYKKLQYYKISAVEDDLNKIRDIVGNENVVKKEHA